MKEAIAAILQTRMDKCTGEQFWGRVARLEPLLKLWRATASESSEKAGWPGWGRF